MKKHIKKLILYSEVLLYPIIPIILSYKGVKTIHLSFDDVYFFTKGKRIILKSDFCEYLKKLNTPYITLFLWKYRKFAMGRGVNTTWKIGLHDTSLLNIAKYNKLITSVYARFHEYKASADEICQYRNLGGCNLFCCHDNNRVSYNLTAEEQHEVNTKNDTLKDSLHYIKTHIRIETLIIPQLIVMRKSELLVMFGHEWGLPYYRRRLELLVNILLKNNIKFIN